MGGISFDRIADRYEATRGGLERGRRFAEAMRPHLAASSSLLEIGVGTGAIAGPLIGLGHQVIGIDLSREMLHRAIARLPGRLVQADAARLPFLDGSFDAVVAVWALHLVDDVAAVAAETARVLRSGGRLLAVAASPEVEPNDLMDVVGRLNQALGRGDDGSGSLAPRLAAAGFHWLGDQPTDELRFDESPTQRADMIETRTWSSLWDLDGATWQAVVQPIVDELRSLPDPDRPRQCIHRHVLSVYSLAVDSSDV